MSATTFLYIAFYLATGIVVFRYATAAVVHPESRKLMMTFSKMSVLAHASYAVFWPLAVVALGWSRIFHPEVWAKARVQRDRPLQDIVDEQMEAVTAFKNDQRS